MSSAVLKEGINFKYHVFGPNETIRAIIKKYNHQNMKESLLVSLCDKYNELNDSKAPHPGDRVKIPLFVGFVGMPQHSRSYENG